MTSESVTEPRVRNGIFLAPFHPVDEDPTLAIQRDLELIELMITDYSMPRMNGGQLARAVHELRPSLPMLLATGFAEMPSGSEIELPRLGKPYTQAQLAAEIGKLLR